MRILLSCFQGPRYANVPAYEFWRGYFKSGLEEAGHEVLEAPVDWAKGLVSNGEALRQWLGEAWDRTVSFVRAELADGGVDLFLSYLFPFQVEPLAVAAIREAGVPTVNFFCDNVREFTAVPKQFLAFDLNWVPETAAMPMYARAGAPALNLPMPMWVRPELRTPPKLENGRVTFVGTADPMRISLFEMLAEHDVPFEIRGTSWRGTETPQNGGPKSRRPLVRRAFDQARFIVTEGPTAALRRFVSRYDRVTVSERLARHIGERPGASEYDSALREAAVTIGVNRCPSFRHSMARPLRYSRLRDLEAPMLGACYVTESAPGLEELYEPGKEIEVYRDAHELAAKIKWLMGDPQTRQNLRVSGQRRALTDHTVPASMKKIVKFFQRGHAR